MTCLIFAPTPSKKTHNPIKVKRRIRYLEQPGTVARDGAQRACAIYTSPTYPLQLHKHVSRMPGMRDASRLLADTHDGVETGRSK